MHTLLSYDKNDSEIPIITRMKERLKPNTHPQNRTLSRLFQKNEQGI